MAAAPRFYVIEFLHEKTVDYVPGIWLIDEKTAFWPKNNAARRRDSSEKPFPDVYRQHDIRVMATADSCLEARNLTSRAENTSCLEEISPKPLRRRIRKRLSSSSSSGNETVASKRQRVFKSPPAVDSDGDGSHSSVAALHLSSFAAHPCLDHSKHTFPENAVRAQSSSSKAKSVRGQSSSSKVKSVRGQSSSAMVKFGASAAHHIPDDVEDIFPENAVRAHSWPFTNHQSAPQDGSSTAGAPSTPGDRLLVNTLTPYQLKTLKNQAEIKALLRQILQKVSLPENQPEQEMIPHSMPARTMEELSELNQWAAESPDNYRQLTSTLNVKMYKDVGSSVRAMLSFIMTTDVAKNVNWCGRGGKLALKNTKLADAIITAVKKVHKLAKSDEIIRPIQEWLKHA